MKIVSIIGKDYYGEWSKSRTACRAVIINEGKILLSYEKNTNQWMIPGGGLEENEKEKQCCIREVEEETGAVIAISKCKLEIDEYYKDWKWVNKYFLGKIVGTTAKRLTQKEEKVGMEPRWVSIDEIIKIFSSYKSYAEVDEMRSGMYLREYTALCELINDIF